MRKIFVVVILMMSIQGIALAQSSNQRRGWGYFVGGAGANVGNGASTGNLSVAGGGEGLLKGGFGMGGEVGYLAPFEGAGNGFGILSVNPSYHFLKASASRKLVPFVTGGFSLGFRNGSSSGGGNFGGGVQYWMKDHLGLRVEFRDHIFSSDSPQFLQFRVGLTF